MHNISKVQSTWRTAVAWVPVEHTISAILYQLIQALPVLEPVVLFFAVKNNFVIIYQQFTDAPTIKNTRLSI